MNVTREPYCKAHVNYPIEINGFTFTEEQIRGEAEHVWSDIQMVREKNGIDAASTFIQRLLAVADMDDYKSEDKILWTLALLWMGEIRIGHQCRIKGGFLPDLDQPLVRLILDDIPHEGDQALHTFAYSLDPLEQVSYDWGTYKRVS